MPVIRALPDQLINQIAAGEVVERPAAAVKELVENALDAGAKKIFVTLRDGGLSEIIVSDDGVGMTADDLPRAVARHATSKLPHDDLVHIHSFGFRGEALASLASVSRVSLISRHDDAEQAYQLNVHGGEVGRIQPAARAKGTRVEVRDLFYNAPARQKFMKTPRAEGDAVREQLQRLALAWPHVHFQLTEEGRKAVELIPGREAYSQRLAEVMGHDFMANKTDVHCEQGAMRLRGSISVPSFQA
ncbi:MAG: DNA mismatch repair protein MutL, partial [Alphaproteobacteria bacterium]|nr:DNA mismatch repair protein MutL [Alphaproteobacteria bacterium]